MRTKDNIAFNTGFLLSMLLRLFFSKDVPILIRSVSQCSCSAPFQNEKAACQNEKVIGCDSSVFNFSGLAFILLHNKQYETYGYTKDET